MRDRLDGRPQNVRVISQGRKEHFLEFGTDRFQGPGMSEHKQGAPKRVTLPSPSGRSYAVDCLIRKRSVSFPYNSLTRGMSC